MSAGLDAYRAAFLVVPNAPPTSFFAKRWYHYAAAIVITILAVFSGTLGPLFLFDVIKPADGKPGTDAGIALSVMAVPFSLVALLGWFNVHARKKPLLRICQEGLEVCVIGASSLDGVPLVPTLIRVAWSIASLQGFKKQIGWIPWDAIGDVRIEGLPMMRSLKIDSVIVYPTIRNELITGKVAESIAFRDAEFSVPLETIVTAVKFYGDPAARSQLPSLSE